MFKWGQVYESSVNTNVTIVTHIYLVNPEISNVFPFGPLMSVCTILITCVCIVCIFLLVTNKVLNPNTVCTHLTEIVQMLLI